ncbi:MAG: XdhC family protein [Rhizomicrobium sp.]|nr:XdhC family protein [Rhizomicrobium sp.]
MQDEFDALFVAEGWLVEGHRVALATVLNTWGSAPRQPGSMLAIRDDGVFAGSVSSGCVEGAVIEAGLAALQDGKLRQLEFGVADDTAWSVGLTCGGRITVVIEALRDQTLVARLNQPRRAARPVGRAVDISSGNAVLFDPEDRKNPLSLSARGRSALIAEIAGASWFITQHNPPVDLVIIGAVHIAQALTKMASQLGYDLRVIDPRKTFASVERFPGVTLFTDYPDEVFAHAPLARRSAVVALAHDPKIDDPALIAALSSSAFYIGALGSQATQATRRERLAALGFTASDIARLHGPIGLSIGSKSPQEIAISILAEIIKAQHLA